MVTGFSLVITIENRGASRAQFYQNQEVLKTIGSNNILKEGIYGLDQGNSFIAPVVATNISPGPFNWTVMIDPQNIVSESDESNNSMFISGTIGQ